MYLILLSTDVIQNFSLFRTLVLCLGVRFVNNSFAKRLAM